MQSKRGADSAAATHFRSERVTSINGRFYFMTREGSLEGPFDSPLEAEREIALYIRKQMQGCDIVDGRMR